MAETKPAPAPAPTIELSDLARQFLDLAAEERTANDRLNTIKVHEGREAFDFAARKALQAQAATRRLAESISTMPNRDLSTVIEKALVAREYGNRWKDGTAIDLTLSDLDLAAGARAVSGILALAGLDDVPVRKSGAALENDTLDRRARRRGEDPSNEWRINQAEYAVIKIDALAKLIWKLADAFTDEEQETIQYIANRLADHHDDLRTALYGDARTLAAKGML
ncbi:MAG: hypothetical protein AB7E81_24100 [Hyphomicrobiaceae bacterium]